MEKCSCRVNKDKAKRQRDNWKRRYINLSKAVETVLEDIELKDPINDKEPVNIEIWKLIALHKTIETESI